MTEVPSGSRVPEPVLPSVTVTILTWNGERYLGDILGALDDQQYGGAFDVLVVDSGSTDRTLQIVAEHPSVRLHEIPNEEFGHGTTRNLAAELATGEIVAYLTHDAVPLGEDWLASLVAPMIDDASVVAVLGRQVARPSAPPLLKYDIDRVFARLSPDGGVSVFFDDGSLDEHARSLATFYSDACSAARRDILLHHVPYRDVDYAEDQVFGRELIDAGYRKAYAPAAVVEHSNDGTLREFGARIAADLTGLRRIGTPIEPVSRFDAFKQWVKWTLMDTGRIVSDPDYSFGRKLYWLVVNPVYHAVKWSNYRRASLGDPAQAQVSGS
jgi:Predicted glycosyltransferases